MSTFIPDSILDSTHHNPFWHTSFADPFVLKVRGRYYAYATADTERPPAGSGVFPILTSPNLVRWHALGTAMPALGEPYFRYWAPEVTEYNGRYLLYYAVHTDEFTAGIHVAIADHPAGPFIDCGHDLTSHLFAWAIDPHVFRDDDGQWYLFMTVEYLNDPDALTGSGNAVARMRDPFTLDGPAARVTPPRHRWQLFEARRPEKGGVDWYCVEGPAVIRHRHRYYQLFSGGCYYRDNYAMSYATSDTPMGPGGMRDASWRDADGEHACLVRGDPPHLISPGHNSLVYGPNNADLYIAYHAWTGDRSGRLPCLDRLYWHGDVPWTPAPTHTAQPAPARPRLCALHDAGSTEDDRWRPYGGQWRIAEGEAVQDDTTAPQAVLRHEDAPGPAWLLEAHARYRAGNGDYGLLLEGADGTTAALTITPGNPPSLSLIGRAVAREQKVILRDMLPAAWHQLLLRQSGSVLEVRVDGLSALDARLIGTPVSSFALLTRQCSAAFSAIGLTDHFRDDFLDPATTPAVLGWHGTPDQPVDSWTVRDGTLQQTDCSGERILVKAASMPQYEYGAAMKLLTPAQEGAYGLMLCYGERDAITVCLTAGTQEPRMAVAGRGALANLALTHALPATFALTDWHTIRLEQRASTPGVCTLSVCLDGPEALRLDVPSRAATPGLITDRAAAAFTGVWQTGLPG